MIRYRSRARIIADLLSTTKALDENGNGVSLTVLLKKCNVSYARMAKLLTQLVGAGLLEEKSDGKHSRYVISSKGLKFLELYSQFDDFSRSYGFRF